MQYEIESRLYIVKTKWQTSLQKPSDGKDMKSMYSRILCLLQKRLVRNTPSIHWCWRMPRLTGSELALDLSKIDARVKIILFSALDSQTANYYLDFITSTFNVKFKHFSMPVTESELLEIINNKSTTR